VFSGYVGGGIQVFAGPPLSTAAAAARYGASMTDELALSGGCNCGAVRYAISEPLVSAGYCHCTRCQRRSGTAASPQAQTAPHAFSVLTGSDQLARWSPPGEGSDKVFCRSCGSSLFSQNPRTPEVVSVRLGTFDRDPGIRPQYRQFVAYAVAWEPIPEDGLPRYDESRPR
jgi:hypothetical protein